MLSLVLLIGTTACGNNSGQSESRQDITGQIEDHSADSIVDSASEPVAEEPRVGVETEASENTADGVGTAGAEEETESNILIAYFSRVGNMDFDEDIDAVTSASVNMDGSDVSGNAQLLAEMAQEVTGGDMLFIETVEKYPAEYRGTTDQAKTEQNNDARPELSSHVENMAAYNTVILIYPNWWGTLPQPVFTFLEEYDFSGKTIMPLCTHEGSRLGRSESDIASLCPGAQLLDGLSVRGSDAGSAQTEVEEWINNSGILE
ncbi:MAG: flavodoxin [Lachnospiraceae bacterium]|nr:flavodoxin [Lachnospiraceae bacterium]